MNPTQPNQKGYPAYGEAVRRVKNQSKEDNGEVFSGLDWVTAAKDMVKELKASKVGEENVIFSLVNRIGLSPETAKLFFDGKYKEELDENTVVKEDNVYNHMSVTTRSGYPYEDYGLDNNRDPFEWEMSSTRYVAKALVIDGRYTYECRFEVLQAGTARWPHPWNFLKDDHEINYVLKISVNQLNVNSNYMRLTPDATPISFNNESNLLKTMKQMFESYNKIWSSNSYQLIAMGTQSVQKLAFLMKLAKEFSKTSGVKVHEKISTEMTERSTQDTAQRNMMWIALSNSKGGKIKEDLVDETTDSSAFAATPFDAKHDFRKDGEEVNAKARESLINMGIISERYDLGYEALLLEAVGDIDAAEVHMVDQPIDIMNYTLPPKKTTICYKLFRHIDGKLYPLFIGKKVPTPMGEWVEAKFIPTPNFDKRPGWHVGVLPMANHLKRHSTGWYADDRVWAEVEVPSDIDWQPVADQSPSKDIKNQVPVGGSYRFKRPKNQGGEWWISGALKINRILSWDEVKLILDEAGEVDAINPPKSKTPNGMGKKRKSPVAEAILNEFAIEHRGDKWVVVGHQGRTVGTHDSEASAKKQIAAIYANGYKENTLGEGQIKVLQSKGGNDFDIIDVISREADSSMFGKSDIDYKGKKYAVKKHPKYSDCIIL